MSHGHSRDLDARKRRKLVLAVRCPLCGAAPGARCLGVERVGGLRYVRAASHQARWDAWRKAQSLL